MELIKCMLTSLLLYQKGHICTLQLALDVESTSQDVFQIRRRGPAGAVSNNSIKVYVCRNDLSFSHWRISWGAWGSMNHQISFCFRFRRFVNILMNVVAAIYIHILYITSFGTRLHRERPGPTPYENTILDDIEQILKSSKMKPWKQQERNK